MWHRRRSVDLVDTEAMDAFFDRLDHLNEVGLMNMRASWNATSHADHEDAWTAVRVAGALYGLTEEIDRVRKKALAWSSRGSNVAPEVRIGQVQNWAVIKMEAGEAIVDAALAIALGDRLDARHRDLLIGPWLSATTAPD
jgi:uncharacterized protein YfiM (DUF2279 family)